MRQQKAEQVMNAVKRELERIGFYRVKLTLAKRGTLPNTRLRTWTIGGHTDNIHWKWTMFIRNDLVPGVNLKPVADSVLGVADRKGQS